MLKSLMNIVTTALFTFVSSSRLRGHALSVPKPRITQSLAFSLPCLSVGFITGPLRRGCIIQEANVLSSITHTLLTSALFCRCTPSYVVAVASRARRYSAINVSPEVPPPSLRLWPPTAMFSSRLVEILAVVGASWTHGS